MQNRPVKDRFIVIKGFYKPDSIVLETAKRSNNYFSQLCFTKQALITILSVLLTGPYGTWKDFLFFQLSFPDPFHDIRYFYP